MMAIKMTAASAIKRMEEIMVIRLMDSDIDVPPAFLLLLRFAIWEIIDLNENTILERIMFFDTLIRRKPYLSPDFLSFSESK